MRHNRPLRTRTLRVETLENRRLLSVSALSVSFKDVAFSATGQFSEMVTINGVTSPESGPSTITGDVQYTTRSHGTGTIQVLPDPSDPVQVSESGSVVDNNGNLSATMAVTVNGNPAGSYHATGKLNVSTLAISMTMSTFTLPGPPAVTVSDATFSANLIQTNPSPFGVAVASPAWHTVGKAEVLDVGVNVTGGVDTVKNETTTAATVALQWADVASTQVTLVGKPIASDTIKIAWNQGDSSYQFKNVPTKVPHGATELVLVTTVGSQVQYTPVPAV